MDYKYTLIVSQYHHSRHSFIVKFEGESFIEKAKKFTAELEKLKRRSSDDRDIDFGDLLYKDGNQIWHRYNVNDTGDIYFINSPYANYCMCEAKKYLEDTIRESKGYIKVGILQQIGEHHPYDIVKKIVEKYFEIV